MSNVAKGLLALMFIGALLGAGINIGESRQKKRDADWYAAHPVVKEVSGLEELYTAAYEKHWTIELDKCRPGELSLSLRQPSGTPEGTSDRGACVGSFAENVQDLLKWIQEEPLATVVPPKPQKGSSHSKEWIIYGFTGRCEPPSCSPVDTTSPLRCADGQILPNDGPCPSR